MESNVDDSSGGVIAIVVSGIPFNVDAAFDIVLCDVSKNELVTCISVIFDCVKVGR